MDATAHAPAGSTEEWLPTREALIEGVTQRCIERELEMATGPGPGIGASPQGIATAFGGFVLRALGDDRVVTLARYALHAEAATTPALREFYAIGADEVDTWMLDVVRRAGSRHPERDLGIIANYVTGLVFHELALPRPGSTLSSGSASSSTPLDGAPHDRHREPVGADPEPARGLHRHP